MLLPMFTDNSLEKVLLESVSANPALGLTTGITYNLPEPANRVLMFTGPIGTVAVTSAFALSAQPRFYRLGKTAHHREAPSCRAVR